MESDRPAMKRFYDLDRVPAYGGPDPEANRNPRIHEVRIASFHIPWKTCAWWTNIANRQQYRGERSPDLRHPRLNRLSSRS
jgi:hypothetical protein